MKRHGFIGYLAVVLLAGPGTAQVPADLAGYWKLNGSLKDYSGNGNDALLSFGAGPYSALTPALLGSGIDGSGNAYGYVGDKPSLSALGGVTLEAWIRLNRYPVPVPGMPCYYGIPVMSKAGPGGSWDDEYSMMVDPSGKLVVHFAGYGGYEKYLSSRVIPLGQWTHVAAVLDTVNRYTAIYINGVEDTRFPTTVVANRDTEIPFYIGMLIGDCAGPRYFDGVIDEVRVWRRGLSHQEIRDNMFCELTGEAEESGGYLERRICYFSGRQWLVRPSTATAPRPPDSNYWSHERENVWVDGDGRLHLRLTKDSASGHWKAAEVESAEAAGYGTYTFTVDSPLGFADPNVVLGLFAFTRNDLAHTVSGCNPDGRPNEIDIEFSCWGSDLLSLLQRITGALGQHSVGPGCKDSSRGGSPPFGVDDATAGRRFFFPIHAPTRHSFVWTPDAILFSSTVPGAARSTESTCISSRGNASGCPSGQEWVRRTAEYIPVPQDHRIVLNLWLLGGAPGRAPGEPVEVVIRQFEASGMMP